MQKFSLAGFALAVAFGGCAHAQQSSPAHGGDRQVQSETVVLPQPPASSWVGFTAVARNGGPRELTGVEAGSPAAAAGFAVGDVILSVDGRDELTQRANFRTFTPGRRYVVRVRRGTEEVEFVLVPGPPQRAP